MTSIDRQIKYADKVNKEREEFLAKGKAAYAKEKAASQPKKDAEAKRRAEIEAQDPRGFWEKTKSGWDKGFRDAARQKAEREAIYKKQRESQPKKPENPSWFDSLWD